MSALVIVPDPARPGTIAESCSVADGGAPVLRGKSLPQPTPTQRLILLWPAELTSVFALQLPPLPAARLRAALVGALEDRLLDDPATLHLAPGPHSEAVRRVVACARQPLQRWLQQSGTAAQPWAAVVPEAALLRPGEAWLSAHQQGLRLLWCDAGGEVGWRLLDAAADAPLPAFQPRCLLHDETCADAARRLAPAGVEVRALSRAQWLARAATSDWDLRQFELAPQAALQAGLRQALRLTQQPQWRRVLGLVAALSLIQLLGINAQAWALHRQRAALEHQLQQQLATVLPGAPLALDPALQLRRALDAERRRSGLPARDGLESLLGAAGQLLPPGSPPRRLRYSPGRLELELDPAAAASARERCQSSAWRCGGDGAQLRVEAP